MYTFELSDRFLSSKEREIFEDYLSFNGLDNSVWEVFSSLFKSEVKNGKPLLLRIYRKTNLYGAIIIIKCFKYGKALFDNKILSGFINLINIPYYQWIKFGCCMDMMSNPGFVITPEDPDEVYKAAISFLKGNSILTIITDYTRNSKLYEAASKLPALPHALIDCSNMTTIRDYTKDHKNLKRKMKVFRNKGGEYIRVDHKLNEEQLSYLKSCFLSTTAKSVFYLPYQDLYLNAALTTSRTPIENVYYFIAMIDGEFIGYQAAIKTGDFLNALHGAFDRNRKTTCHAYDILFVKMTDFAIEHGLKICDFGAVLNHTKQNMVNKTIKMSYFLFSKYPFIQFLFNVLLKLTKVQSNDQLKYRDDILINSHKAL